MESNKQIKLGATLSYLSIAINIISGLLYTPWMIDKVGQSDYGLYTLSNSLITLFLVDFGLGSATGRYIAKYRAEGRQQEIDNFLGLIYKLYLIIDAVICLALVVVFVNLDWIYSKLTLLELSRFKAVYVITALFSVINFPFVTLNGILTAYEKFIQLKTADLLYRLLLVGCTVAALLAGHGLYALVAIHALAGLLVTAYKFWVIRKNTTVKPNFRYRDTALYKEIFTFSFWITITVLAQRLIFNITPSILGAVVGSGAIAVFGVVTTIEGYTYTITSAISGLFLPKISRIYQEKDADKNIMPVFIRIGKFQCGLNGLIVAGFAVLGKQFIRLWMGQDYLDAYFGILLVSVPGLFYNSLEIASTAMIVQNKVNLQAYINVIAGIINVVLSIILSSYWGMIGSCVSIFIAYMIRAVLLNLICWKVMGFNMKLFFRKCYLIMICPITGTILAGYIINTALPYESWMTFIIKGIGVVGSYFLLIYVFGLDQSEKIRCNSLLKRFIHK